MGFNFYLVPNFEQDQRWSLDESALAAAIETHWPTAEILRADDANPQMVFTIPQDGHSLTFRYDTQDPMPRSLC
jgi:hypothetical protein